MGTHLQALILSSSIFNEQKVAVSFKYMDWESYKHNSCVSPEFYHLFYFQPTNTSQSPSFISLKYFVLVFSTSFVRVCVCKCVSKRALGDIEGSFWGLKNISRFHVIIFICWRWHFCKTLLSWTFVEKMLQK